MSLRLRDSQSKHSEHATGTTPAAKFEFHISDPPGGQGEESLLVTRHLVDRHKALTNEWRRKVARIQGYRARQKAALEKRVGQELLDGLHAFSRQQRQSNYGLGRGQTKTPDFAARAAAKRSARNKGLSLLTEAGFNPEDLKAAQRGFDRQIARLHQPASTASDRLSIVPESEVPKQIRAGKTNPWTVRNPPFDGWSAALDVTQRGGSNPWFGNFNGHGGTVGNQDQYSNDDASDDDAFQMRYDANVGFWFQAPQAGQYEIWAKLSPDNTHGRIWLDDEWGWSDSDTWMSAYVYVDIPATCAGEDRVLAWQFHVQGNPDEGTYDMPVFGPAPVWFHYFTAPIPKPGWVFVQVGAYAEHWVWLNDVSTLSDMDNIWEISQVWLHAT